MRIAKSGIKPICSGSYLAGKVLPVKHFGSVDVFLKAMKDASQGDIMVIDIESRMDVAKMSCNAIMIDRVRAAKQHANA